MAQRKELSHLLELMGRRGLTTRHRVSEEDSTGFAPTFTTTPKVSINIPIVWAREVAKLAKVTQLGSVRTRDILSLVGSLLDLHTVTLKENTRI